jgi:predicted transposase YbfD/YdcC
MHPTLPSLASVLAQVPDPRAARGQRHPWAALLLLLVVGLLSGLNSQRAIARWGRDASWRSLERLGFTRRGGPSQPTLHRVLQQVDVGPLEAALGAWLQQVRAAWRHGAARWLDGIALDGKTLRGARRLGAHEPVLLSACCQRLGVVLGEVAVPADGNELSAVGPLLDALLVQGETVTFDAQFTQWLVAEQVVRQGGAYLLVIKGNQPTLLADSQRATAWPARYLGQAHTARLAHGRYEERTLVAADAQDIAWPHARQVLRLHHRFVHKRTRQVLSDETLYAVTSLTPAQATPAALLRLWQAHWTIENRLHWLRDVVLGEDRSTTRTARAPEAFAAFRNLALSLLHLWRGREVTAAREYYGRHPAALFRRLDLAPVRRL